MIQFSVTCYCVIGVSYIIFSRSDQLSRGDNSITVVFCCRQTTRTRWPDNGAMIRKSHVYLRAYVTSVENRLVIYLFHFSCGRNSIFSMLVSVSHSTNRFHLHWTPSYWRKLVVQHQLHFRRLVLRVNVHQSISLQHHVEQVSGSVQGN